MPNKYFTKSFNDFKFEPVYESDDLLNNGHFINEGLFDKLATYISKFITVFKDKDSVNKSVEAAIVQAGEKGRKFLPKMVKIKDTVMVSMSDGKSSANNFVIAFTKLADLPDGSSIFQISGTTSTVMLKALTGTENEEDLSKNTVLAIIAASGFEKGKPATMKLLKNVIPNGKDYVTKFLVEGSVSNLEVEKNLTKLI